MLHEGDNPEQIKLVVADGFLLTLKRDENSENLRSHSSNPRFFCFFECCELHGTLRNAISVLVLLALPACVRPDGRGLRAQKNTNKT